MDFQPCDLETNVLVLKSTQVQFVRVLVFLSRPVSKALFFSRPLPKVMVSVFISTVRSWLEGLETETLTQTKTID